MDQQGLVEAMVVLENRFCFYVSINVGMGNKNLPIGTHRLYASPVYPGGQLQTAK